MDLYFGSDRNLQQITRQYIESNVLLDGIRAKERAAEVQ
jgi:hypothetical protein